MPTPEQTKAGYANLWNRADVLSNRKGSAENIAKKIIANKAVYQRIQNRTGVPWYFTGPIHDRESSLNFKTHLHNGDPLTGKTYHVPAGRPTSPMPPGGYKFEDSAVDALTMPPHSLNKIGAAGWTLERILYEMEKYNGWGYFGKTNSPYLWSWTDEYSRGKYVADDVYDPNHVDQQAGTVAILKTLERLDPEVATALKNRQPKPPKGLVDDEVSEGTKREKAVVGGGVATGGAGGAGTQVPEKTPGASVITNWLVPTAIVIGIVAVAVGLILLARKGQLIRERIAAQWGET